MVDPAALALIAELPRAQAEVVAPRMLDGLGVAEVAHITGNNSNAVRELSHAGLRRLASELQAASVGGQSPRKGA